MANDVNIKIGAQDNASDVFTRLKNNADQSFGKKGLAGAVALGQIGANALMSAVSGVVGAIGDTVTKSRDFEAQMKRVQSITKSSGKEFKDLEKLAKDMGSTTAFSASEAAEGIQFLGMAGFSTDEIMKALPDTLLLASAGALDLGTSADIASNILSGMRMETEELGHVVNTLAITATSSNTDVSQLGQAFKFVSGTAATAGVSFEETSAALGILADNSFAGSTGGTALNSAFVQMLKPSREAEKAMSDLGLKFVDNNDKLRSLKDITNDVTEANLSAKDMITIFGTEGSRAISALVGSGVERMEKLTNAYETNTSAAKDMAKTNMDSFAGAMKELESATEAVQLALGGSLMPVLKNLLRDYVTPAVQGFAQFTTEMGGIIGIASDFQLAMSALWTGVGESIDKFFSDPVWRDKMLGLFGEFVTSWQNTFIAWQYTLGNLIVDGARLLFSPIASAGELVWDNLKTYAIRVFGETTNGIKEGINGLIESFNTIGSALGLEIDKFDITPVTVDAPKTIEETWGEVKTNWSTNWETMKTNAETNMEMVRGQASKTAEVAKNIFNETPIAANEDLKRLKEKYAEAMKTDDDSIENQSEETGKNAGKTIATEAGENLRKNKSLITSAFSDFKSDFEADLTNSFRKALGGDFKGALSSFGNNMIDGILDNVAEKFSKGITDALFGDGDTGFSLGGIFANGKDGQGGGFLGGFRKSIGDFFGGEDSEIGGFFGSIKKALPAAALVGLGMKYIAPPLVEGVGRGIEAGANVLNSAFNLGGGNVNRTTQDAFIFDPHKFDSRLSRQLLSEGFNVGQTLTKSELEAQAQMVGLEGDILQYLGGAEIKTVPLSSIHSPASDERDPNAVAQILGGYGESQGDRDARARAELQETFDNDTNESEKRKRQWKIEQVISAVKNRARNPATGVTLRPDHINAVDSFLMETGNHDWFFQKYEEYGEALRASEDVISIIAQLGEKRPNSSLGGIPRFRGGGRVGGALGSPQLIMAHGGEQVIPASTGNMDFLGGGSRGSSVNMYFNVTLSSPDVDGARRLVEGEFGDIIIERLKRDGFDGREVVASDGVINPVTV